MNSQIHFRSSFLCLIISVPFSTVNVFLSVMALPWPLTFPRAFLWGMSRLLSQSPSITDPSRLSQGAEQHITVFTAPPHGEIIPYHIKGGHSTAILKRITRQKHTNEHDTGSTNIRFLSHYRPTVCPSCAFTVWVRRQHMAAVCMNTRNHWGFLPYLCLSRCIITE